MKSVFLLVGVVILLSSCASTEDSSAPAPNPKEQRQELKKREEFAKSLPPPR
jgi:hypothetical protein